MSKKTAAQYNDMTRVAAFKIVNALMVFDQMDPQMRQHAEQVTMERVQHIMRGDQGVIEGDNLIHEIVESTPEPAPPPVEAEVPAP